MASRNRVRTYLLTFALLILSIEGTSQLGLLYLQKLGIVYAPIPLALSEDQKAAIRDRIEKFRQSGVFGKHDPVLGWTVPRGMDSDEFRSNSQGIRADTEYSRHPLPDKMRVSAFGDSFTLGSEVQNQDTWEEQLHRSDARFEVLNFGMGGYGLDQAYLRYQRDGVAFGSDIVIIGYMSENLCRNVNVFRPFYSDMYSTSLFTKPRFLIEDDRLVLSKNPWSTVADYEELLENDGAMLKEIGKHDYYYHARYSEGAFDVLRSVRLVKMVGSLARTRLNGVFTLDGTYRPQSDAYRVTVMIFEKFYREALENGSLPVVLIYPDLNDMNRFLNGETRRYEPLLDLFRSTGVRYIDLLDAFAEYDPRFKIAELTVGTWGHLSPLGNKIVARYVLRYFEKEGFSGRENIKKALHLELDQVAKQK